MCIRDSSRTCVGTCRVYPCVPLGFQFFNDSPPPRVASRPVPGRAPFQAPRSLSWPSAPVLSPGPQRADVCHPGIDSSFRSVAHSKNKSNVKTTGTTFSHFSHELVYHHYPQAIPGMAVIVGKPYHSFHLMSNIIAVPVSYTHLTLPTTPYV